MTSSAQRHLPHSAQAYAAALRDNPDDPRFKGPDQTNSRSSLAHEAEELHTTLMMQRANSPQSQSLPYLERVKDLEAHRHEADEVVRHQLINPPPAED